MQLLVNDAVLMGFLVTFWIRNTTLLYTASGGRLKQLMLTCKTILHLSQRPEYYGYSKTFSLNLIASNMKYSLFICLTEFGH